MCVLNSDCNALLFKYPGNPVIFTRDRSCSAPDLDDFAFDTPDNDDMDMDTNEDDMCLDDKDDPL